MTFSMSPDNDGPLAKRVDVSSSVENPGGAIFQGGQSDVTWELRDPTQSAISSNTATIADGSTETWDTSSQAIVEGDWSVFVSADGDNVNLDHEVLILYQEGSESPANPRP